MASHRPKRARKIVNYGEDHLHWVEETQIQKAMLRSLHDTPSKKQKKTEAFASEESSDDDNSDVKSPITKEKRKVVTKTKEEETKVFRPEENFELRLTRLQSKLLEEHGIFDPNTSPATRSKYDQIIMDTQDLCHVNLHDLNSDTNKTTVKVQKLSPKKLFSTEQNSLSPDKDQEGALYRVRAQRKFASNTSPPRTRSSSPVKMHRQKPLVNDKDGVLKARRRLRNASSDDSALNDPSRPVRASSSQSNQQNSAEVSETDGKATLRRSNRRSFPPSVFNMVPKTDKFLSYLCFRNTKLQVKLEE